ncbi:MAG TPA: hypothetical protein VFG37_12010 [Planctomycetota bacterium]|nr:hypothetical protein [Planctomycetota bacterium]
MPRVAKTIPPNRSARLSRLLVAAVVLAGAGCARSGEVAADVHRLGDLAKAAKAVMVEVAGEARLALRVAAGEVVHCEVRLPAEPCWLDVEAAALPDGDPAEHAQDGVVVDVVQVAGAQRTTLLHTVADPGTKPSAFGWGHARVEVRDHLGEAVTFELRVEPAPGAPGAPNAIVRPGTFAIALPRLAPRADANDRAWSFVDWLGAGPTAEEIDASGAPQNWPGHRRLLAASDAVEVVRVAPASDTAGTRPAGAASPAEVVASGVELQAFGSEDPLDEGEAARRACDRFARVDPFARDGDDPALRGLARLDRALRADRARALGERTLQIELTRPRRAALCVEVTSLRDGATCDAALSRLLDYLAVNQQLERTLLLVRTRPAGGGHGLVVARLPAGWRERAPAALVARFDARAPELARR